MREQPRQQSAAVFCSEIIPGRRQTKTSPATRRDLEVGCQWIDHIAAEAQSKLIVEKMVAHQR